MTGFRGEAAPLRLTEAEIQRAPMLSLRRKGQHRGVRCLLGLHPWTSWTDMVGHWALVKQADGTEIRKEVLVSRRWCPRCTCGETMVVL